MKIIIIYYSHVEVDGPRLNLRCWHSTNVTCKLCSHSKGWQDD